MKEEVRRGNVIYCFEGYATNSGGSDTGHMVASGLVAYQEADVC